MASGTLYTLTEVKERTGISLPTLQKYKKKHQDRIPSVGEGRTQRYPESALAVFEQLKRENLKKRGRPRKKSSQENTRYASAESSSAGELLTLKQVSELTGISYPTLSRYTKTSLPRIPHVGKGRKRRYKPDAVGVFKTLYEESKRGRRKKGGPSKPSPKGARQVTQVVSADIDLGPLVDQLKELRKAQRDLQRQVDKLEKEVRKPFKITLRRA
ncbi:MAG: helix-turn-helix domain-containing protein [Thermoanaerobaculia bacterium]|nr:helix-turn-helix domain-containing protein [Thermoanaerobaculia bacterium]